MTPEAQRLAIAKWCGWLDPRTDNTTFEGLPILAAIHPELRLLQAVPDYLNDLNAMHTAEAKLHGREQLERWNDSFYGVGRDAGLTSDNVSDWPMHATAAQRAEALLRTLNLWTED